MRKNRDRLDPVAPALAGKDDPLPAPISEARIPVTPRIKGDYTLIWAGFAAVALAGAVFLVLPRYYQIDLGSSAPASLSPSAPAAAVGPAAPPPAAAIEAQPEAAAPLPEVTVRDSVPMPAGAKPAPRDVAVTTAPHAVPTPPVPPPKPEIKPEMRLATPSPPPPPKPELKADAASPKPRTEPRPIRLVPPDQPDADAPKPIVLKPPEPEPAAAPAPKPVKSAKRDTRRRPHSTPADPVSVAAPGESPPLDAADLPPPAPATGE